MNLPDFDAKKFQPPDFSHARAGGWRGDLPPVEDSKPVELVRVSDSVVKPYSSEDDKAYADYVHSLGDQVEPETTSGEFDAFRVEAFEELDNNLVYGDFTLVGHGKMTNKNCGRFLKWMGCNRHDLHNLATLQGVSFKNKDFVHKTFNHCDRPSCPVCYRRGWAFREAEKITDKIVEAAKTRGLAEHCIVGVPQYLWEFPYEKLRKWAKDAAFNRGVVGGVLIFHGFRYRRYDIYRNGIRNMRGWYWAPHFHIIGFLLNSYTKCRNCEKAVKTYVTGGGKTVKQIGNGEVCKGCSGFEALTRRLNREEHERYKRKMGSLYVPQFTKAFTDLNGVFHPSVEKLVGGWIVKVMDARKSILGTAWYQLNHASYKIGVERFQVAVWFGNCGCRKLKVTPEIKERLCPCCKQKLVKLRYFGSALLNDPALFSGSDILVEHFEDGREVWVEDTAVAWYEKFHK